MNLVPEIREDVLQKSITRARARNIILPTFAQQKDPTRIPAAISARLKDVGLWDLDPANLFRITWKNQPVRRAAALAALNANSVLAAPHAETMNARRSTPRLLAYSPAQSWAS